MVGGDKGPLCRGECFRDGRSGWLCSRSKSVTEQIPETDYQRMTWQVWRCGSRLEAGIDDKNWV